MVSKITVIALVLIVACPILIGYGMAFEEHDKDVWTSERTRSVNGLLNNDTAWTWTMANTYTMNGLNVLCDVNGHQMTPHYNSIAASPITSIEVSQIAYSANATISISSTDYGTVFFDDPSSAVTLHVTYLSGGVPTTFNQALTISASFSGGSLYGYYQTPLGVNVAYNFDDVQSFSFSKSVHVQQNVTGSYADPAVGWTIDQLLYASYAQLPIYWRPYSGFVTDMVVLTVDFGPSMATMTPGQNLGASIYAVTNGMTTNHPIDVSMHQTSAPGDDSWMTFNGTYVPTKQNIGGNFSSTGNVWQFVFTLDGVEAYYIGDWNDQIGRAKYYQFVDFPYEYAADTDPRVTELRGLALEDGLTYRVDYVHARSSSYAVATDVTWKPNDLLQDSQSSYRITLGDGQIGTSITWGGETYKITDGKITVGTVKYNVKDLELDSRYLDGTRTNYINGRQISTGANELQLGGSWTAIVNISELSYSTTKVTEWTPGKFAWNGVDQSFALMGLITCAAVFVGLGMYGARSGAKVGKLMIICGCAAFVFLALM